MTSLFIPRMRPITKESKIGPRSPKIEADVHQDQQMQLLSKESEVSGVYHPRGRYYNRPKEN
jgi:hypothetical protein